MLLNEIKSICERVCACALCIMFVDFSGVNIHRDEASSKGISIICVGEL